MEAEPPSETQY